MPQVCTLKSWKCPRVSYLCPFVPRSLQVTAVNVKRALGSGKRSAANAERDCQRKFAKLGFSLPIAIRSVNHEIGKATYTSEWVKVSDWLLYFLRHMPSALGSATSSFGAQCTAFWTLFKHVHPSHELYSSHKRWDRCVPICLYGDEGRGPKRANFMDFSWETPFGVFDHTQCKCTCSSDVAGAPQHAVPFGDQASFTSGLCNTAKTLTTNLKAPSYVTKHLVFGLPSYIYKSYPHVLQTHLDLVASDMKHLYEEGIKVQGDTWYGALIAIKGDQKFHAETAGEFSRSYATLGRKQQLEMCAWCLAGPHPFVFEEVDHEPNWMQTQFSSRPWSNDTPPILSTIPFDTSRPEYMFKFDMFHLLKVGMTRDLVGSLVVVLCRLGFFDDETDPRDLPSRLERAHGSFKLWCLLEKKSPGLRSFTRAYFNYPTFQSTPWANSKGSDTSLMVRWLTFFTGLQLKTDPRGLDGFLRVARRVLINVTESHKICETHGLWMPRQCGQALYLKLMVVCKGYHVLAQYGLSFAMICFGLKPKYHSVKHLLLELRTQIRSGASWVLNPNIHCCESNEDHVGKVSSLSRRVSTRTLGKRLMQRYFLKTRALLVRHKAKHGKGCL